MSTVLTYNLTLLLHFNQRNKYFIPLVPGIIAITVICIYRMETVIAKTLVWFGARPSIDRHVNTPRKKLPLYQIDLSVPRPLSWNPIYK